VESLSNTQNELPRLVPVSVLTEYGFGRVSAYDVLRTMPPGIVVRFGRRVRLNADRLRAWIEAGGTAAS
jgi:hypothetical protein